MGNRRSSIRYRFFAAISAVALVFIGVLLILNVFFYEDYYLLMRRGELRDTYLSIRGSYQSYTGGSNALAAALDSYASQTAIRLAVVCADGSVPYASFLTPDEERENTQTHSPFVLPDFDMLEQQRRGTAILQSISDTIDWNALHRQDHQFLTVTLWDNEQYLCIAGALDQELDKCLFAYMPYAYIEQNSSLNLLFLLIAGGCSLLICLVCAYFISRQFTRPLIAMAGVADRMSELDFSTQYEGGGTDEIGRLGSSLNRLSSYLEQTIRELKASNERLACEVRKKERIDNMRQEFIINVSHELKTPIALIQGYAEGLTAGVADDPEDRKYYCDTIADEADRMNKLVMQLLALSRLELGAEQTYTEDIDLHTLCAETVRKTAVLRESRNLTVDASDTCVSVRTDGDLLEQVLMNYLSNAIRYTADGGRIVLTAVRTETGVRLTVFNEGEGLPEEELPRIWEKFYRTDRARTRVSGGSGIGLSLVRAIADTLGGDCGAQNVEGGIAFWFSLPDAEEGGNAE